MSNTYTVTTYSYTCQVCGIRTNGVPRMSEIPRCLICNISLCKHCFQNGLCPSHWKQLPIFFQQNLIKITNNVWKRKKLGILGFFIFLPGSLGALIGIATEGEIEVAMPVFFSILFLAMCSLFRAMTPIGTLRKREEKFMKKFLGSHPLSQAIKSPPISTSTTPPSEIAVITPLDPSKKQCSACGVVINKDAKFCEKCGQKLV